MPEVPITVDGMIRFGELTAQEIARRVGVDLNYVLNRALLMNAPFSERRTRAEIAADLRGQLAAMLGNFSRQVARDRRTDPI